MRKEVKPLINILPVTKFGCYFRFVENEDAEFIVKLRNDSKLSRYLSKTSASGLDQKEWINNYKIRENLGQEYYIMCIDIITKQRLGVNRIYNINDKDFEIGSWLFEKNADIIEFENVTYKPNCAVAMIDTSPPLEVAYALSRMGKHVKIKDRYSVIIEVMKEYGDAFTYETIN